MSALNGNKPAFPMHPNVHEKTDMEIDVLSGMDLRDYFAAKALSALLGCEQGRQDSSIAKVAYQYADDMISARDVHASDDQRIVSNAKQIVRDILDTWYPGHECLPADNLQSLLNQIFNSLWGVPEFAKTVDARLHMQNVLRSASKATGATP